MPRNPNTRRNGSPFSETTRQLVWRKASLAAGYDPNRIRKDLCGAFILYDHYGQTSSQFGWEIDHINPVARGGGDELSNLQPLQWENNRHKGDSPPNRWNCKVSA